MLSVWPLDRLPSEFAIPQIHTKRPRTKRVCENDFSRTMTRLSANCLPNHTHNGYVPSAFAKDDFSRTRTGVVSLLLVWPLDRLPSDFANHKRGTNKYFSTTRTRIVSLPLIYETSLDRLPSDFANTPTTQKNGHAPSAFQKMISRQHARALSAS